MIEVAEQHWGTLRNACRKIDDPRTPFPRIGLFPALLAWRQLLRSQSMMSSLRCTQPNGSQSSGVLGAPYVILLMLRSNRMATCSPLQTPDNNPLHAEPRAARVPKSTSFAAAR